MNKKLIKNSFFFPSLIFYYDAKYLKADSILFNSTYSPRKQLTCVVSSSATAFLINLPTQVALVSTKEGVTLIYFYPEYYNDYKAIIKLTANLFNKTLITTTYGAYRSLQFISFRFRQRWYRTMQVVRYKIGYNTRVWLRAPSDFVSIIRKISPKKRTHIYFSKHTRELQRFIKLLYTARPGTLYKGRGVNVKEQPMILKEGKKSLW